MNDTTTTTTTAADLDRLQAERDRAVATVAALLDAYIGVTPGVDAPGLHADVLRQAEALLTERDTARRWAARWRGYAWHLRALLATTEHGLENVKLKYWLDYANGRTAAAEQERDRLRGEVAALRSRLHDLGGPDE